MKNIQNTWMDEKNVGILVFTTYIHRLSTFRFIFSAISVLLVDTVHLGTRVLDFTFWLVCAIVELSWVGLPVISVGCACADANMRASQPRAARNDTISAQNIQPVASTQQQQQQQLNYPNERQQQQQMYNDGDTTNKVNNSSVSNAMMSVYRRLHRYLRRRVSFFFLCLSVSGTTQRKLSTNFDEFFLEREMSD